MRRTVTIFVVMFALIAAMSSVSASGLNFGVRQYSFHDSFIPSEKSLGAFFGIPLGDRFILQFGGDFWNYKFSADVTGIEVGEQTITTEASVSAGSFLLHGGVKLYLAEPAKGNAVGYISGEFFKGFGLFSIDPEIEGADFDDIKELMSPWGFTAGFGAEFFASDHFSVGGETGFRYVRYSVTTDVDLSSLLDIEGLLGGVHGSSATSTAKESTFSMTTMTVYFGLTLNFIL